MMQSRSRNKSLKLMLSALFMTTALTMTTWSALAGASTAVDVRDMATYGHDPMAEILLNAMKNSPTQFFPQGVSFSLDGPGRSRDWSSERHRTKVRKNTVYGVELSAEPQNLHNGSTSFSLVAMIHTQTQGTFFRKMTATVGGAPLSVQSVQVLDDIPLSQTHFSIEVGLLQRKAILTDAEHGIKKIYPLGVGSFDFGVSDDSQGRNVLMTPVFQNANLTRSPRATTGAQARPSYYAKMPYMALTRATGRISGIAFHILQHPHSAPQPHRPDYNYMIRGFDSHGCMRVREKDLYELYSILMGQGAQRLPVNVSLQIADPSDHPYPLENSMYQQVKNYGTVEHPEYRRDEHRLTETEVIQGVPPIERLDMVNPQRATLEELENYNGGETGDELPEFLEDELSGEEALG